MELFLIGFENLFFLIHAEFDRILWVIFVILIFL
jgi:hypothetical protein